MSQLMPFVRAFRALVRPLEVQADGANNETAQRVLQGMAEAFDDAATALEQQIAADLSRIVRFESEPRA